MESFVTWSQASFAHFGAFCIILIHNADSVEALGNVIFLLIQVA